MDLETKKKVATVGAVVLGVALAGGFLVHEFSSSASHHETVAVTQTTAPVRAPYQEPAPVTAPVTPHRGDNASEKQQKLAALEAMDLALLHGQGIRVGNPIDKNTGQPIRPFGRSCNADGTTNGDGWHGTSTAISYDAQKNGQTGLICVAHSGKGGSNLAPSVFAPK